MSDSSQGPGWWQASDGKWYPPEQHPSAHAPPAQPPQQQKNSGCLKWGLIGFAIVAVLGIGAIGCIAVVGNEVSENIDQAVGEAAESDYTAELADCENEADFGTTTASGTITNTSDSEQGFEVSVRFEDGEGTLVEISSTFVDRLAIDQTGNWETTTFANGAGEEDVTCEIDEVSYTIFDE